MGMVTGPHYVLASTLTLLYPGGTNYAHHILMFPPSFESHRRACSVPNRIVGRNKRAGGKILKKTLNVQDRIDVQGGKKFWKINKHAGGNEPKSVLLLLHLP